jgi:hypothetical protein
VSHALPDNALVFTSQYSGGIRFYGGRLTLRFDFLDREWTDKDASELERLGYHPYLVIDDWEAPYVREQFHLPPDSALPWTLVARLQARGNLVSVYDLSAHPGRVTPVVIQSGVEPLCLAPRELVLTARRP